MRVLGIDPGMTRCGIGVVDSEKVGSLELVDVGVCTTDKDLPQDQRLLKIFKSLSSWIEKYLPDVISIERMFSQNNHSTVLGTAQVAGLAMVIAAQHKIPVALHTPSEVKATVTGSGTATKQQIQFTISKLLKINGIINPPDAADALALAITHIYRPTGAIEGNDTEQRTTAQKQWAAAEQKAGKKTKKQLGF